MSKFTKIIPTITLQMFVSVHSVNFRAILNFSPRGQWLTCKGTIILVLELLPFKISMTVNLHHPYKHGEKMKPFLHRKSKIVDLFFSWKFITEFEGFTSCIMYMYHNTVDVPFMGSNEIKRRNDISTGSQINELLGFNTVNPDRE